MKEKTKMKLKFLTLALLGTLTVSLYGVEVESSSDLRWDSGKAVPYVQQKPFFQLDLGKNSNCWDLKSKTNYLDLVTMDPQGTLFGQKCFLVYRQDDKPSTDTFWGISSKPFPCNAPAGNVIISVCAATSEDMERTLYSSTPCEIEWRNAKGETLSRSPFYFNDYNRSFTVSQTPGIIPPGTKSFVLRLGMDTPNILKGSYFAVKSVSLISTAKKVNYVKSYTYTTGILSAGDGRISWKSSTPAGTSIKIAVSTAPHNRNKSGFPVKWSKFGKEFDKEFTVRQPWVKLKITHYTAKGKYPELRELNAGGQRITHFHSPRVPAVPLVENLSSVGPTENSKCPVVLRITCPTPVHWGSLKVAVDGKDVTASLKRKGDIVTWAPAEPFAPGKHTIKVSVSNIKGIASNNTKYLIIGKHRSPHTPKTTLRDDGVTLIDGKPFFPIGIYGVCKCFFNNNDWDKCMQDLQKTGFNLLHTYERVNSPEGAPYLAAVKKYGFKMWFEGRDPFKRQLLNQHIKNSDILAWYLGDDTSDYTHPARFIDLYDASRAVDGSRLTCQADGTGVHKKVSQYRDFVLGSDVFMPEIYPGQRNTDIDREKSVAQIIHEMKECTFDIAVSGTQRPRALWPIIQYFYSTVRDNPKRGWLRFPDRDEMRAMSYAAIIHGGQGIIWYTYGKKPYNGEIIGAFGVNSTPERWKDITEITREFQYLSDVLTSRTPSEQPETPHVLSGPAQDHYGRPSVTCLLKKHNGKYYLFAVNATRKSVKAQFRLPVAKAGKVLFENRSVPVKSGVLTDTFKPFDVHVYEF